ncbi:hypothetical protein I4F81_009164 [Pyropia yezoensis]|uniref:Uncharacterized protein n=1 Tax=Pyropia yezoensis TaxID=2788 RepID=A0ACC3C996_PYRYE|nr:hypothetical protein I4F81_009164 [Neopyropia yezoensis]
MTPSRGGATATVVAGAQRDSVDVGGQRHDGRRRRRRWAAPWLSANTPRSRFAVALLPPHATAARPTLAAARRCSSSRPPHLQPSQWPPRWAPPIVDSDILGAVDWLEATLVAAAMALAGQTACPPAWTAVTGTAAATRVCGPVGVSVHHFRERGRVGGDRRRSRRLWCRRPPRVAAAAAAATECATRAAAVTLPSPGRGLAWPSTAAAGSCSWRRGLQRGSQLDAPGSRIIRWRTTLARHDGNRGGGGGDAIPAAPPADLGRQRRPLPLVEASKESAAQEVGLGAPRNVHHLHAARGHGRCIRRRLPCAVAVRHAPPPGSGGSHRH